MSAEPTVVLAPNPGVATGPGTNTYLAGDGSELVCIDPGPEIAEHRDAILAAAHRRGGRIADIALTHSHPDHRPLARSLSAATGAPVHAFDTSYGDGAQRLDDGAVLEVGGLRLVAVHTPGHAADHLCFHDPGAAALYTGDHVLGGMTTVINPPGGDMTLYMASLRRVLALAPAVIHPAHGPRIDDGVATVEGYIAHRLEREEQVLAELRARAAPARPADLVAAIYAAYPRELWPLAARSVLAHLDKLAAEGRAERHEGVEDGPLFSSRG